MKKHFVLNCYFVLKEVRAFAKHRTRRLVLEAWNAMEASGELPMENGGWQLGNSDWRMGEEEKRLAQAEPHDTPQAGAAPEPAIDHSPPTTDPAQPMLSDFGLYKCCQCGKLVMGYEKGNHEKTVHEGRAVEWRKVR